MRPRLKARGPPPLERASRNPRRSEDRSLDLDQGQDMGQMDLDQGQDMGQMDLDQGQDMGQMDLDQGQDMGTVPRAGSGSARDCFPG